MTPPKLLIGLCLDRAASLSQSYEEEVTRCKKEFRRLLGKCKLSFYEAAYPAAGDHGLRSGTDIVVYDYGGMLPGCEDLLASNARAIIRWADENPNGVVLVVSSFTWGHQIKYELEDSGLDLHNIVDFHLYDEELLPEWLRGLSVDEKPLKALRLPGSSVFFKPSKKFITWLVARASGDVIIDAGCGSGHTLKLLHTAGAKAIGIDINTPVSPDTSKPFPIDATHFGYIDNCIVLIARPCHSDWIAKTIGRAKTKAKEILYVGLSKNQSDDLAEYGDLFKQIGKNAGEDGEGVWSYKPKELRS